VSTLHSCHIAYLDKIQQMGIDISALVDVVDDDDDDV
jgi:hypothetical protein